MKYGTSKYGTIKYGVYTISKVITTNNTYSETIRYRLRSKTQSVIAKNITCPLTDKVRVNDTIAMIKNIDGTYNMIRIRGNNDTSWIVSKGVE